MQILGYGEDALTLWALRNKLDAILSKLGDSSSQEKHTVFFRPSFGRRGGSRSSQFGEFDFIILADRRVYLGESKWHRSSRDVAGSKLHLRQEQLDRHKIMAWYITEWTKRGFSKWKDFLSEKERRITDEGVSKPMAPAGSLLAENLKAILDVIRERYASSPKVENVLLYLYNGRKHETPPQEAADDFALVKLDYSEAVRSEGEVLANFVRL